MKPNFFKFSDQQLLCNKLMHSQEWPLAQYMWRFRRFDYMFEWDFFIIVKTIYFVFVSCLINMAVVTK